MDSEKKKQLKADYNSKCPVGAVYEIVCNGSRRRCIKSTTDIAGIKNRYNFSMMINSCPDPFFNREFKELGAGAFSLKVLEELKKKESQTFAEFSADIKQLYELWLEKTDTEND